MMHLLCAGRLWKKRIPQREPGEKILEKIHLKFLNIIKGSRRKTLPLNVLFVL